VKPETGISLSQRQLTLKEMYKPPGHHQIYYILRKSLQISLCLMKKNLTIFWTREFFDVLNFLVVAPSTSHSHNIIHPLPARSSELTVPKTVLYQNFVFIPFLSYTSYMHNPITILGDMY
jgi:hypothetical protein